MKARRKPRARLVGSVFRFDNPVIGSLVRLLIDDGRDHSIEIKVS